MASLNALAAMNPAFVLQPGDLCYADGWGWRWDSCGDVYEPMASSYPMLTTGGNHEVGTAEQWMGYYARYPTPHKGAGSSNPCYYGKEVGPTHIISICSYAGFFNTSLQYAWLENYLETKINRTKTPWIIAQMHVPFYSSNVGHFMEGELQRRSMEHLLYKYGVDIVVAGHVHSVERTAAVYDNELNECGSVYFNLGDGGNYEGTYINWNTSNTPYQWSVFKEGSFGVAELIIYNDTHAYYSWHRHACWNASIEYPNPAGNAHFQV